MSVSEISTDSLETMSLLTVSSSWRKSLKEKYGISLKEKEMENWKSNVQRMKQEIDEKIEEIRKEIKKDTKTLLNSFIEGELFKIKFPEKIEKTMRRKRRFDEIEQA